MGKVENYILEKIGSDGAMLFVFIDPLDHPSLSKASDTAAEAYEAGADLILVGGSIGVQGGELDEVTKRIKERVSIPVVLFPGNIGTLTKYADAVYFMQLLNSRNPYWISQAQTLAAPVVKRLRVEPLPVGYVIVEPGGTVGWVGDANKVPRDKPQIAAALALAGEYVGSRFIVTDVGSASPLGPVPLEMVRAVRSAISIPYVVAGGIRTSKQAREIIKAGADAVHVGTVAEEAKNVKATIERFVKEIKEEGKKRRG